MMAKTKQERNRYATQYSKEHYEQINLTAPKGTKAKWKEYSDREGKSITRFIIDCVQEHESKTE